MDCQQWKVILQSQKFQLDNLQLKKYTPFEVKSQVFDEIHAVLPSMCTIKIAEAKSIANYFQIAILPSFINTILHLSKVLHFQNIDSLERLKSLLLRCGVGAFGLGDQLKKRRAQLSLCFSRKWREQERTIYILMHNYPTQKVNKTRVYLLNQRGLMLHVFSNLESVSYASTIIKFIKKHYGKVQQIILMGPEANIADLDSFGIFRECDQPNIILVNYRSKESLNLVIKHKQINPALFTIVNQDNRLVLAKYGGQQLLVWYNQSIGCGQISSHLQRLHEIVTREIYISQLFVPYDYYSEHFSQKQLLLRLFSFYFNFTALQAVHVDNILLLHEGVMKSVANELQIRLQQDKRKFDQEQAHTFTSNVSALYCPVCNRRSKIICKKCCMEFNRFFALCEAKCFQTFHKDRFSFSATIEQCKKYRYYEIIGQENSPIKKEEYESSNSKDKSKKESNLSSDIASMTQVASYKKLRQKWGKEMEGLKDQMSLFNNHYGIAMISQQVMQKISYLQTKVVPSLMINQIVLTTKLTKLEEYT